MHEDETVQRIRPLRHPPRIFGERSADRQAVAAPRLGGFRSAFQANRRARRAQADGLFAQYLAALASLARLSAERDEKARIEFPAELLALDDPRLPTLLEQQRQLHDSRRRALRLELDGLAETVAGSQAQLDGLQAALRSKEQQRAALEEQLRGLRQLASEGYVPRNRLLDSERLLAQVNGEIAGDLGSLTFYRVLLGIGMGMEFPIAQSLLSEMIPASRRGKYIALMDGFWPLGFVAAGCLSYFLLPLTGWRSIFLVLALPAVFVLAIRFLIPESPRWLLSKGRDADAERVIRQVYGEAFSLENLPEQALERKVTIWHLLYAGYGKRMLFVTLFWTCSVIPVFAVYAFAPKVLLALNLKGDWASYGSVAITLLFVIGCIIATRLINRIGRRCMLLHSFLWSGLALLGLGVFHAGSEATILGLFGAYALFIGGAQVLQLVYPNELFPTEIRAFAVGVGTSLSRVGAAVGTYLVPLSLETLGTAQTMYAAALVTLLGLLVTWALAPETRSLNLQQAASLT